MKLANLIGTVTTALAMTAIAAIAQSADEGATTQAPAAEIAEECGFFSCLVEGVRFANPLDPSTWWDGSGAMTHEMTQMEITPTDPEFLMKIPNPATHSQLHMSLTNPENWGQFMKPDTFGRIMSPDHIAKWLDPKTFDVLIDPQTYAYWAQPGAFKHVVTIEHYSQLVDPQAYLNLFKDVTSAWMPVSES